MKTGHLRLPMKAYEYDYIASRFARRFYCSYHRHDNRRDAKRSFARRTRRWLKTRLRRDGE